MKKWLSMQPSAAKEEGVCIVDILEQGVFLFYFISFLVNYQRSPHILVVNNWLTHSKAFFA